MLAVCDNTPNNNSDDWRSVSSGGGSFPMDPYTFTLVRPAPIPANVAAAETRASTQIANAGMLMLRAVQAGGGSNIDCWNVAPSDRQQLNVAVGNPHGGSYRFEL